MANPQIAYYENGNVASEIWYVCDRYHRLNGPAVIYYEGNGNIQGEYWYENGQQHRLNGPAAIIYYENGNRKIEYWFIEGNEIDPPYDNYPLTKEQQVEMKLTYG